MKAEDLVLNIAVNLGRISKMASQGQMRRAQQFLKETEGYLKRLEKTPKSKQFSKTLKTFKERFPKLKTNLNSSEEWAEEVLTWANILEHRAKLA